MQELDLRSNEIYDVSELSRLIVLPHLRKLFVADGNPFVEEPDATKGNGWRIALFNAFLQDSGHRRQIEDLPEIDGFPASWNERRYLVEPSSSGFTTSQLPVNGNRRVLHQTAEPAHIVVSPRKVRQPSSHSSVSKRASNGASIFGESPPPPVPRLPADLQQAPLLPATIDSDDSSVRAVKPKVVRRKHRRIVNLDDEAGNDASPAKSRQHERSVSSPGWAAEDGAKAFNDAPQPHGRGYHTLSSVSTGKGKSRTINRKLSESTFSPSPATGEVLSGSGSEVEEFRRKMEQLRDEIGAENWLSVYANQGLKK